MFDSVYFDIFVQVIDLLAIALASIGAFVIVYGGMKALVHYLQEVFGKAHAKKLNVDHIRLEFGRDIVLALEYFVAADLIKTVVIPDYYEIGLLGALVVIRTILSVFLNKEIERLDPHDRNKLR